MASFHFYVFAYLCISITQLSHRPSAMARAVPLPVRVDHRTSEVDALVHNDGGNRPVLSEGLHGFEGDRGTRGGPVDHEAEGFPQLLSYLDHHPHRAQVVRARTGWDEHEIGVARIVCSKVGGVSITTKFTDWRRSSAMYEGKRLTSTAAKLGASACRWFHQSARLPWGSVSTITTGPYPPWAASTARWALSVVFPAPPFCEATVNISMYTSVRIYVYTCQWIYGCMYIRTSRLKEVHGGATHVGALRRLNATFSAKVAFATERGRNRG